MRIEQLFEQSGKTAAVAFGRLNPPTIGHQKVVEAILKQKADVHLLFVSHTHKPTGKNKTRFENPLPFDVKLGFIQQAFPNINIGDTSVSTTIGLLQYLEKHGFENVIFVAGSDRVAAFEELFNKQNGIDYNLKSIQVVSSGVRDPDAEGAEGMSASKMRAAAVANNFDLFKTGLPMGLQNDAKTVFDAVRQGLEPWLEQTEGIRFEESKMFFDLSSDYKKFIKEDVIAYDPNGYWDVYLWGNWYNGRHFDYGPRKVAVPGTTESEALEWIQNHAEDIYEYYYKKKFHNGKRMLPHPVDKNLFLEKTKPIGPSQSYRVPPAESVVEAPIEMDPNEPMNPMIYGAGGNPAKLQYRMARAAGQLKDLAARAANASPSEWQMISKHFEELTMNINQIKHGLEELAKQRRKGGIRSRGIDTMIDSIEESIRKVGSKFRLVSKSTGKNLGTYDTKAGAEKRERQVQYFKHKG